MRKFLLGTDWWTDCDDVVALRILARAHKAGEIDLIGIALNGCMEYSVASIEGFLNTEGVHNIPIGIDLEANDFGGNPPYQKRLSKYAERFKSNNEAENAVRLYRRLLAESDGNIEILEIGYLQVIADVLESGPDDISEMSGVELIREKVSKIWVMAGKWDEEEGRENNFARNPRSRKAGAVFCEKCPVPAVFLGWEIGASVITGSRLQEGDVLRDALKDHGSEKGRMSWDPMLVMLALYGDEEKAGYTCVKGRATVNPETGLNRFEKDDTGIHSYVVKVKPDEYYRDMIDERIQ